MQIDTSTEFGQRVARRLQEERIIWLITTGPDGTPQPRPVWFWWDGQTFLIYSRLGGRKLPHIAHNPRVALHFDGDGRGGDIVVFTGQAQVDESAPPPHHMAEYAAKYAAGIARINMTPEQFAAAYSVAIRVTPTGLRGH